MKLETLPTYANELENLEKLDVKTEKDELGNLYVTETKETYIFMDETEADEKINHSVADPNCIAHSKKYKQGKMNKAGEIVKPETWTVVIKLNH